MKKVLFATTALVFSAGIAAAEVTISGYGRFGADYDSTRDDGPGNSNKSTTVIEQRLRFNIDAVTTTDGGVEFGGRLRLQYDDGKSATTTSPALLYVSYGGLRVEVGNVNTPLDTDALSLSSEVGLTATSFGDPRSSYYAFNTNGYGAGKNNQTGIFARYSIDAFTIKASYIDPDQTVDSTGTDLVSEKSLSFTYEAGPIVLSAVGVWNGEGIESNNIWFVGAGYAFNDQFTAGLNYTDEGYESANKVGDLGKTVTLYGTYTIDAVSVTGYIANNDADINKDDTVYGLGGAYDLGGGTSLLASVERGYGSKAYDSGETRGTLGVQFNF